MRERAILDRVYAANALLPPSVVLPPGDDMGAVRLGAERVLVTVDQVADGVHFRLAEAPIALIARKAITRNLSDVAAMAAQPLAAVVAAALPRGLGEDRAEALSLALRQTAASFDCPLIGGDLCVWDHPMLLSVTVLAHPAGVEPVLRRGAQPGDAVCVTGALGGSLLDLRGRVHHLAFEPRLREARALASNPATRPTAMIDLSDGLAKDLRHLLEPDGLACTLDLAALPLSEAAHLAQQADGVPAWRHAMTDGEDYELCFTLPPAAARALSSVLGTPITVIGHVHREGPPGEILIVSRGDTRPFTGTGYEHADT